MEVTSHVKCFAVLLHEILVFNIWYWYLRSLCSRCTYDKILVAYVFGPIV